MTFHDEQITRYLSHSPDVRNAHVAKIFGVEPSHVAAIRRRSGIHPARKAAQARGIKPADLDDKILSAVYKRDLVAMVLEDAT